MRLISCRDTYADVPMLKPCRPRQSSWVSRVTEVMLTDGCSSAHADGITLGSDIKGVSGVKDYMQAYIDKYDFEHEVITGAVDEQAQVTFSFWQDKVREAQTST